MNLKHNSRQEKLEGRLFYYSPTPTLDGLAEDIGQWPLRDLSPSPSVSGGPLGC